MVPRPIGGVAGGNSEDFGFRGREKHHGSFGVDEERGQETAAQAACQRSPLYL